MDKLVELIVRGNMRGAVLSGHLLVCWNCWGSTVPVTKMGTIFMICTWSY